MEIHTRTVSISGFKHKITLVVVQIARDNGNTFGIGNGYMIIRSEDFPEFVKLTKTENIDDVDYRFCDICITWNSSLSNFMDLFNEFDCEMLSSYDIKNDKVIGFDTHYDGAIKKYNTTESIFNAMEKFLTYTDDEDDE